MKKIISLCAIFLLWGTAAFANDAPKPGVGFFIYAPQGDSGVATCVANNNCGPSSSDVMKNYAWSNPDGMVYLYIDAFSFDGEALYNDFKNNVSNVQVMQNLVKAYGQSLGPNTRIIFLIDVDDGQLTSASATVLINTLNSILGSDDWGKKGVTGIMFDLETAAAQSSSGANFLQTIATRMPANNMLLVFSGKVSDSPTWSFWPAIAHDGSACPTGNCQSGFWVIPGYDLEGSNDVMSNAINDYEGSIFTVANRAASELTGDHYAQFAFAGSGSQNDAANYEIFTPTIDKHFDWQNLANSDYWGSMNVISKPEQCAESPSNCNEYTQTYNGKLVQQCQYTCVALSGVNALLYGSSGGAVCGGIPETAHSVSQPFKNNLIGAAFYEIQPTGFSAAKCVPGGANCPNPVSYPESIDPTTWAMIQNWADGYWSNQVVSPVCPPAVA